MKELGALEVAALAAQFFERLGIPYVVVGSVARPSSASSTCSDEHWWKSENRRWSRDGAGCSFRQVATSYPKTP